MYSLKISAIAVLISILCYWSLPVSAQEDDFRFSVGVISWFAKWKTDFFKGSGFGEIGPKVTFGYKNFGLGMVFLKGSFDADIKGGAKGTADRTDFDTVLQYSFTRYLSASLGFKYLTYDLKSKYQDTKESLTGVGLGIGGFYPIADTGFYSYGLLSYLPSLSLHYETSISGSKETDSGDGHALNFEVGLGYSFARIPLGIDLGYRRQTVDKKGLERNTSDKFDGPVIDVTYTF